jgi:hypothetical protein
MPCPARAQFARAYIAANRSKIEGMDRAMSIILEQWPGIIRPGFDLEVLPLYGGWLESPEGRI